MGRSTPPCEKNPAWTQARYRTFIRSSLRQMSIKWKPQQEAWVRARRPSTLDDKRIKWEYECCVCHNWFLRKDCENNHVHPVGTMMEGMDHSTIGDWIDRLLAPVEGFEILCKACHLALTNEQNQARREDET